MAVFNPDVPDIQPTNYLSYSKQGEGNKSLGVALSGAGETFKAAVTGADEYIKQTIDKALYDKIDTQREGFTGALEEIGGVPADKRVADIQVTQSAPTATGGALNNFQRSRKKPLRL